MSISATLAPIAPATVTDQVFESVYTAIITLEIKPGDKVSEADTAKALGVSRQPVRDAFYRLSQLGLLVIRPQRATRISHISPRAIKDAIFVRTALEVEALHGAIKEATPECLVVLEEMLLGQLAAANAGDKLSFHALDDAFHQQLFNMAGHGQVWELVREQKIHMERIRYLSLDTGAHAAYKEHVEIFEAIKAGNTQAADQALRRHFDGLDSLLETVRRTHADLFVAE